MGVLTRRSRVADTADVAVDRLRRGAHDVLDTVTDAMTGAAEVVSDAVTGAVTGAAGAVSDVAGDLGDRVGAQVTAARRDLADRIDPAPVPRRGLRLLVIGLLVTTVSAVVWAVLARRSVAVPHGNPEHLPTPVTDADAADPGSATGAADSDETPAPGLTGDPEASAGS